MFDLYLITSGGRPDAIVREVAEALRGAEPGRVGVQLRAKQFDNVALQEVGHELRELTRAAQALLLVNGSVEIASAVGADGVHLPEHGASVAQARAQLGAQALIGVSRHDATGLARAAAEQASFATLSPVFAVLGKQQPLGLGGFAELRRGARLPVFALGGLAAQHAQPLMAAGACGLALIRGVFAAREPAAAVQECLRALDAARAARAAAER